MKGKKKTNKNKKDKNHKKHKILKTHKTNKMHKNKSTNNQGQVHDYAKKILTWSYLQWLKLLR